MKPKYLPLRGHLVLAGPNALPVDANGAAGLVVQLGLSRGAEHDALNRLPVEHEWQPDRVEHRGAVHDLEMQVRRRGGASIADFSKLLAGAERFAVANDDSAGPQVGMENPASAANILNHVLAARGIDGSALGRAWKLVRLVIDRLDGRSRRGEDRRTVEQPGPQFVERPVAASAAW